MKEHLAIKSAFEGADEVKTRTMLAATTAMLVFVFLSCLASELSWSNKEDSSSSMRQLIGLPSIAIGNLNPSAKIQV